MKRATAYTRFSSEKQTEASTAAQMAQILDYAKKNGGLCGRNAPFGYINVYHDGKRQLAIDPDRSQAVKHLFEMYANGATMLQLAKWLNERKYKTQRGNAFTIDSVRGILTNEIYKGVLTFNKKRVRGKMNPYTDVVCINAPQFAIVSKDLWERAQKDTRHEKPNHWTSSFTSRTVCVF
ncbi:recombinase family protein [Mesotoga sp.]|uniref:recombinase family protein n=1 Tax=Mesotoga sp. TaxID=2053577 RepID=UPI001BD6D6E9|nr:recombinase family protein [Mesotoga sp.]